MTTTSKAPRQLSDQNSQGTILGASTSDAIGFYGLSTGVAKNTTNFATLSMSSGALSSSIAIVLGSLGIITCTSVSG
jgi:hypothetical protein